MTLWLDPVCPFSWNTARWLTSVAGSAGFAVELQLMNLAILNEGHDVPPEKQPQMDDSKRLGRLMTAIRTEVGPEGLAAAYFAFGKQYFDRSAALDDQLAEHLLAAADARQTTVDALADTTLDPSVRQSHRAGQEALGETGGSPIVRINGQTFFGPVLTTVPNPAAGRELFDSVAVLAATPEFSQLQRPRAHP
ncbi:hypothetical protein [Mycobacterium sp.]|uniref:mycothiol-dependent nitroreductase Rv2466c family protein n=1 Tax=Mycobacterium sp. TaxID=1785 RepID=UPI003A89289F